MIVAYQKKVLLKLMHYFFFLVILLWIIMLKLISEIVKGTYHPYPIQAYLENLEGRFLYDKLNVFKLMPHFCMQQ